MRGRPEQQTTLITLMNVESRIPKLHPIREVKRPTGYVFRQMDSHFEDLYAEKGRSSIPPERLLGAKILMALYSVRSDRQFCERLRYDLFFQWFLNINPDESGAIFDASSFSKNQERLLGMPRRIPSLLKSWSWRKQAAGRATNILVWMER